MTPAILLLIGAVSIIAAAVVFILTGLKFFLILATALVIVVALGFLVTKDKG